MSLQFSRGGSGDDLTPNSFFPLVEKGLSANVQGNFPFSYKAWISPVVDTKKLCDPCTSQIMTNRDENFPQIGWHRKCSDSFHQ